MKDELEDAETCYSDSMREAIKNWLKREKISRIELANKCGVSLSSVNNWLSKSEKHPIPKLKLAFIEGLMKEMQPVATPQHAQNAGEVKAFAVQMSSEDYQRCLAASLKSGYATIEAWAAAVLTEAAYEKVPVVDKNKNNLPQVS